MKKTKHNKPNKKQPHIKGPIVLNIHDNPVNIKIRVGTLISGLSNEDIPHTLFPLDESEISKLRDVIERYPKTLGRIDLSCLNQSSRPRKKTMATSADRNETKHATDTVTTKVIAADTSGSIQKIIGLICKGLGFGTLIIGGTVAINHWWKKRG